MSASGRTLSLCLLAHFLVYSFTKEITKTPGEEVLLDCQSSRGAAIIVLKWIRPDLKSEGYVFCFKDGQPNYDVQHESFHGRVGLKDREMKDRDFSVILKNVNINDNGTYECHVGSGGDTKLINTINLIVKDSGDVERRTGDRDNEEDGGNITKIVVPIVVSVVVLLVIIAIVIYIKHRERRGPTDQKSNKQTKHSAELHWLNIPEPQQLQSDSVGESSPAVAVTQQREEQRS